MVKKIRFYSIKSKEKRKLSLAASFTLFLTSITIILVIGVFIAILFPVDSLVRDSRKAFINQEMQGIGRQLINYMEQRNSVLKDYVNFPIMTQAVMQPQENLANIHDFLDDITLLGSKVPLTLLDYSGYIIYSTEANNKSYKYLYTEAIQEYEKNLILNLIRNEQSKEFDWQIIRPIIYQGHAEGFLVAEIPMSKVVDALVLKESSQNHRIQIRNKGQIYLDIGLQNSPVLFDIPLGNFDLTLSYNSDESVLREGRKQLIFELISSLIVFFVLSLLLVNFFSRRYLITPLERLRQFTHDLAEGKPITMDDSLHRFSEISELESYFKSMVNKVVNRERSLEEAKTKLEGLNTLLITQQQQLVHSEKLASVGHLAAGVAHEINNPAAYVKGNMEVLKDYKDSIQQVISAYDILEDEIGNSENPTLKELVYSIQLLKKDQDLEYILSDIENLLIESLCGIERIQKISIDLKKFSRVVGTDKTIVDINQEVIETTLRLVESELKYKCSLNIDLAELPPLNCYPGELGQVIMNLLINARDAIHEKGEISITSQLINQSIQIKISDTGKGISKENILKVFDPFFTTKDVGKGTGLGLSISLDIVKKHEGNLSVESQLGVGTCFSLILPLDAKTVSQMNL